MCALKMPTNQKRLTNVSVVRMKRGGQRFEIACYPNKVRAWRDRIEKDLSQVLQTEAVFANVSKGEVAKREDMKKAFGTENVSEICQLILNKGEIQLTEKERSAQQQAMLKDIAKLIADRCLNPDTKRPYTSVAIESALKDAHFVVKLNKSSKQQALDGIRALRTAGRLPIQRALMRARLRLADPLLRPDALALCSRIITDSSAAASSSESSDPTQKQQQPLELVVAMEPAGVRALEDLLRSRSPGSSLEVLDLRLEEDGDDPENGDDFVDEADHSDGAKAENIAVDNSKSEADAAAAAAAEELNRRLTLAAEDDDY
ncbi:hypothetical protein BOX15_Mlig032844g1 [Macrostomum lignano]|uniref:Ribosome maturation protein SBDS n=2 Tax=Macrostomum lignano TaxID=282301 RepID=A0A1I8GTD6_9PLAT|nr:hypothetical protein BOX15_Mlig032844g1 [Macrostomum lignano]